MKRTSVLARVPVGVLALAVMAGIGEASASPDLRNAVTRVVDGQADYMRHRRGHSSRGANRGAAVGAGIIAGALGAAAIATSRPYRDEDYEPAHGYPMGGYYPNAVTNGHNPAYYGYYHARRPGNASRSYENQGYHGRGYGYGGHRSLIVTDPAGRPVTTPGAAAR